MCHQTQIVYIIIFKERFYFNEYKRQEHRCSLMKPSWWERKKKITDNTSAFVFLFLYNLHKENLLQRTELSPKLSLKENQYFNQILFPSDQFILRLGGAPRRGIVVSKFNPHWLPHNSCFMPASTYINLFICLHDYTEKFFDPLPEIWAKWQTF